MGESVSPCIIYQRLRLSAPDASNYASEHIWPLTDELVERKGYTPCGLYGDSEFAPPFRGGSEIRPGFEAAWAHTKRIAAKLGTCTLLIGDAAAIGDGDPFLPPYEPQRSTGGAKIRIVNLHLRPRARSTSLRSAWRHFDDHRQTQHEAAMGQQIELEPDHADIELVVLEAPELWLARLYLSNPATFPLTVQWKQQVRSLVECTAHERSTDWQHLAVAPRRAAYLESILQGELPWVRQLRFKFELAGRKMLGVVHMSPGDMHRKVLPLVWEGGARE